MWFAAHIITSFRSSNDKDGEIIAEESVYLIEAEGDQDANQKATEIAERVSRTGISYLDPKPSTIENLGLRKIVSISNPDLGNDEKPSHGTEVTYDVLVFKGKAELEKFISNSEIVARYWIPEKSTP